MDPYKAGIAKGRPVCTKRDVCAEIVVVLATRREGRGLKLIAPYTRVIALHEIHELVIADHEDARPNGTVDDVAYVGFVEITQGGVVMVGDHVWISRKFIGVVAGFEEAHMPNHRNIIIRAEERRSGFDLGISVGDRIVITSNGLEDTRHEWAASVVSEKH